MVSKESLNQFCAVSTDSTSGTSSPVLPNGKMKSGFPILLPTSRIKSTDDPRYFVTLEVKSNWPRDLETLTYTDFTTKKKKFSYKTSILFPDRKRDHFGILQWVYNPLSWLTFPHNNINFRDLTKLPILRENKKRKKVIHYSLPLSRP